VLAGERIQLQGDAALSAARFPLFAATAAFLRIALRGRRGAPKKKLPRPIRARQREAR